MRLHLPLPTLVSRQIKNFVPTSAGSLPCWQTKYEFRSCVCRCPPLLADKLRIFFLRLPTSTLAGRQIKNIVPASADAHPCRQTNQVFCPCVCWLFTLLADKSSISLLRLLMPTHAGRQPYRIGEILLSGKLDDASSSSLFQAELHRGGACTAHCLM